MTARRRAARAAAAVVAVLGLVAGCTADAAPAPRRAASDGAATRPAYVLPGCPSLAHVRPRAGGLPDLELPCLGDGPAVRLSDLRGTPMVLNVWAAWCQNCYREMPLFADAMHRAGDRVRFFGIHYKAPKGYGVRSAADFGVPFPSVHDEDGDRTVAALHVTGPPQTFFVTAEGRVAGRKVGEIRSRAELAGLVRRYLGVRL